MANNIFKTLFIFVLLMKEKTDLVIAVRKYIPQTDLSEHCKRRVVPSIFLGNQVMDSNAYVMHFSHLEVPYSCFLSVRAESGYNIIMVIQLLSEYSLVKACSNNQDQLIVYELGETFGGYWGPQPIIKPQTRNYTQYYTLKTTPPMKTSRPYKYKKVSQKVLQQSFPEPTEKEPDYIRMDVPLVNVSGNLQLAGPLRHTFNAEEMFDFIYDVTPRNGVEYETSIMPLVQFSIRSQNNADFYDGTPRYELDYDIRGFTTDFRLTFSTVNRRTMSKKRKWFNYRRYNYGKKNNKPYLIDDTKRNYQNFFDRLPSSSSNATIKSTVIHVPTLESKVSTTSWKYIDDIMKYFNITSNQSPQVENATIRAILHDISNIDHNFSVYLVPNISTYIRNKANVKKIFNPFTKKDLTNPPLQPILLSSNPHLTSKSLLNTKYEKFRNVSIDLNKINSETFKNTVTIQIQRNFDNNRSITIPFENKTNIYNSLENIEIKKNNVTLTKEKSYNNESYGAETATISFKSKFTTIVPIKTGTMVDHESWDNIVQAAPVMAVVLNKNELLSFNNKTEARSKDTDDSSKKSKRKKRYIQALQIENSRPRNLTTKRAVSTETEQSSRISDIQDLARLVELQDDEIAGRVALRYLRNYVGSALFNICDFSEAKMRQTFLFNASRIVIALNNFTMDHMMLVVTPAQTLLNPMSRCPSGYLECQAVGTRVCIDSTNSCDGVPNCGSYDIYDEDRLLCGVSKDLQFNIYLAAMTFLAVLLTMLYIVYYWLKRCVPKVSEAFFIYTDVSENTLFLDPVMRSPTDVDDGSCKLVFSEHFFDDDLYQDKEEGVGTNSCAELLRKCCAFLLCLRKPENTQSKDIIEDYPKPSQSAKTFSFTELELRKYTPMSLKDEAIQTVENYEEVKNNERKGELRCRDSEKESLNKHKSSTHDEDYANELNLIKFAKETRSSSSQSDTLTVDKNNLKMKRRYAIIADDEKEIRSTVYDHRSNKTPSRSEKISRRVEVDVEGSKKHDDVKRLRFEDAPTMIPSVDDEDDSAVKTIERRNVALGTGHTSKQNVDAITENKETSSASKDFMRFWGAKSKKGKKKQKQPTML